VRFQGIAGQMNGCDSVPEFHDEATFGGKVHVDGRIPRKTRLFLQVIHLPCHASENALNAANQPRSYPQILPTIQG
jgi:hypothetical protein